MTISKIYSWISRITTDIEQEDIKFSSKMKYFFFSPFFYSIELYLYFRFYKKIVLYELLTNDAILLFLDEEDFKYKRGELTRIDLVEDFIPEYQEYKSEISLKNELKIRSAEKLVAIINDKTRMNIVDYFGITIKLEDRIIRDKEYGLGQAKIYYLVLHYVRKQFLDYFRKKNIWFFSFLILFITLYFLILRIK